MLSSYNDIDKRRMLMHWTAMRRLCVALRKVQFTYLVLLLVLGLVVQDLWLNSNRKILHRDAVIRNPESDSFTDLIPDNNDIENNVQIEKYDFYNSAMGRDFHVREVNCAKIIEGDAKETAKALGLSVENLPKPRDELTIYMDIKTGCAQYKRRRGFILDYLSKEERDFPIAMNIMLYKEFHQVEDLLRAVYRPQNHYCLHVDRTAAGEVHAVTRAFADCFDNVVVPRDVIDVVYGQLNLMTPEMVCMYELTRYKTWKYFINWTGQEYPTKTNRQMVEIFKAFNGANDVVTSARKTQSQAFRNRWNKHGRPPHGVQLVKGSSHIVLSRDFVDFITTDRRVRDVISFLFDTIFPEESFWTSINNDPTLKAPGGFNGTMDEAINKTWNGRVKWWLGNPGVNCTGFFKHAICIFGVADVGRLVKEPPIIANKFYWDSQPMALRCMQEWVYNRTRDEYLGLYTFDASQYARLPNAVKAYRRTNRT